MNMLSRRHFLRASGAVVGATMVPSVMRPGRARAADISLVHGLALADSVVYATARRHRAKLVTADADFEELPEAVVIR